jgi:hypothetical protein
MGIGSCESTASSHRAHLQRSPGQSTYSDEPSSQEHKPGRIERLAKPMVQAAPDFARLPRFHESPSCRPPQGLQDGTAARHG